MPSRRSARNTRTIAAPRGLEAPYASLVSPSAARLSAIKAAKTAERGAAANYKAALKLVNETDPLSGEYSGRQSALEAAAALLVECRGRLARVLGGLDPEAQS